MSRAKELEKWLSTVSDNSNRGMKRLIFALRRDDELMAELMAVCSRKGPASNDSDWEWCESDDPHCSNAWFHGGSGLGATHHLPEPNQP